MFFIKNQKQENIFYKLFLFFITFVIYEIEKGFYFAKWFRA